MKLLCAVALIALAGCGGDGSDGYTANQLKMLDGFDASTTCPLVQTMGGPEDAWAKSTDGTETITYDEWAEVIDDEC